MLVLRLRLCLCLHVGLVSDSGLDLSHRFGLGYGLADVLDLVFKVKI